MFARVAARYDRANHWLSLGIDRWWRRQAVRSVGVEQCHRVLDVCAGTGDLSLALAGAGATVVGSDFCPEMLDYAEVKAGRAGLASGCSRPRFVAADTMALPFPADSFDAASVAFGIRNVADPVAGLREMARVVRAGGRVVVLEFSLPRGPLRPLYLLYFRRVLPRLGEWISGDHGGAYAYLSSSVMRFPERDSFLELMRDAGLVHPRYRLLTGGVAALYSAEVP